MRIGILTLFHGNNNWGGNLQGYALKTHIQQLYPTARVDLIRYSSSANVIYKNKIEQMLQYGPVDAAKKVLERVIKPQNPVGSRLKKRNELFAAFQRECLTNKHVYRDEDLSELANEYDCLICGSDQIWNPNVALPGFFLKNVQGVKKVSFAASIARDALSPKEKEAMIPLISQFDAVSVREKTAKDILDGELQGKKEIFEVIDPALMRTKEQWGELIGDAAPTDPYALVFFFSDSSAYRERITAYCRERGLKLIGIPHAAKYIEADEQGWYEKAYDVGPIEFLKLFRDASCVFTDSFHGSAFSILFEKPFFVFERDKKSKVSKNSRLYDLLEKFSLSSRLVRGEQALLGCEDIDYAAVLEILQRERAHGTAFLKGALDTVEEKPHPAPITVADLSKKDCCGCTLCQEICPRGCIVMREDAEGYSYPVVDESACIRCGLCVKKCTQKNPAKKTEQTTNTYIAYHPTQEIREKSSSGGVFHALAKSVLEQGGVVFGAGFDESFGVRHMRVTSVDELPLIMRSKYVQSDLSPVLPLILEDLQSGKTVLFSGTPCQVGAVYRLANDKKLTEKLYLVDFICHGVPSPGIWRSYLHYVAKDAPVKFVNFRDKTRGWHDFHFSVEYGKRRLVESHEKNVFMRTFLSDRNLRSSCYDCRYKGEGYVSDITLADAWKIEKEYEPWADDKGTSLLVVRSKQGSALLEACREALCLRDSNYDFWARMNPSLVSPTVIGSGRKALFADFAEMKEEDFWNKYKQIPVKKRARYAAKRAVKALRLEKLLRKKL